MRIAVSRSPNAERVVTPLELFFDLVHVFAIGQLSHHLLEHIDLRTGAETAILALAVFYAWYMTAWGANWLESDRLPVQLLLVGLMFVSLLMSVAIAEAFGGRAWLRFGGATSSAPTAIGIEVVENAADVGGVGWWAMWTLMLMVLALIGIAVGDELAIAHPGDEATLGFTIFTFGGPALFLLAQVFFLRSVLGYVPRSRLLGLVALAILALATAPLTLIVGIAASSAVLVAVAIAGTVR